MNAAHNATKAKSVGVVRAGIQLALLSDQVDITADGQVGEFGGEGGFVFFAGGVPSEQPDMLFDLPRVLDGHIEVSAEFESFTCVAALNANHVSFNSGPAEVISGVMLNPSFQSGRGTVGRCSRVCFLDHFLATFPNLLLTFAFE